MNAIRQKYERYGVQNYYSREGNNYRNPHEFIIKMLVTKIVKEWSLNLSNVLDLACGSGEVTLALQKHGVTKIVGVDPYTYKAYEKRVNSEAERISFEDILEGKLLNRKYSTIFCSFALHLLEVSKLPGVLLQLSLISPSLVTLSPHKRPQITEAMGWNLEREIEISRVKARLYHSQQYRARLRC